MKAADVFYVPGSTQPGRWCVACHMPTLLITLMYALSEDWVRHVGTMRACDYCAVQVWTKA